MVRHQRARLLRRLQRALRIQRAAVYHPRPPVVGAIPDGPRKSHRRGRYHDGHRRQCTGGRYRLAGCYLNVHIYDNGTETAATAETNLKTHVGPYYDRTIVSEYAGGTAFLQGLTTQMKTWAMGSCYWAGLEGTGGIARLNGAAPNTRSPSTMRLRSR